jgi:hypothetical protein
VCSLTDDQGGLAPPTSNTLVPDIKQPTPPSSERGQGSARSSEKMSSARRPSASKRSSAGGWSSIVTFVQNFFLLQIFPFYHILIVWVISPWYIFLFIHMLLKLKLYIAFYTFIHVYYSSTTIVYPYTKSVIFCLIKFCKLML